MCAARKLWTPSEDFIKNSNLTKYNNWLKEHYNLLFDNYNELWQWSVDEVPLFWKSISEFFNVQFHSPYKSVMSDDPMPFTKWFEGSTLNYAEHIFRNKTSERPAILFASERKEMTSVSWTELEKQTAALQTYLKQQNIKPEDRVAAYLPNIPQATVSLLATISLGAVWSSCSPDFGSGSVLDRFRQIAPKILIAVDGYTYNGASYDRIEMVKEISEHLPSVEKIILIPYLNARPDVQGIKNVISWNEVMSTPSQELSFTPVPFSHPIWILYSSGTTGIPKAITHSHGGMLLEHLKYLSFHNDVHRGENFFWFSTTGWMMWNFVQASLLVGATIVLYDGSPGYPSISALWKIARLAPIHHFGTSAPYLIACKKRKLDPESIADLSSLRSIGSTGAPLPPEGFDYVYENIKPDVWLCSMSGGTDICTALVGGNPWNPVYEGEIQCRTLGCSMYAFDDDGKPVTDQVGEMVITMPMPCMPVYFWNDKDFKRYRSSYFEFYPGIWRHGDWITITPEGGLVIHGRSDTTLNRQGVRIGTAEIYRSVDKVADIKDSLIVNIELPHGGDFMPLFVLMQDGKPLTDEIKLAVRKQIREDCSPRHVPDEIVEVPDLPYTISGKKMEAPVKRILMGKAIDKAANPGAMRNPDSLNFFVSFGKEKKLIV
ncbi:MAG: acetoacetate--CoA ligase [Chitinophagaceae bacterium]|nr:acetoacetate--CoA ligase [Chitinophagaceae bacterium]